MVLWFCRTGVHDEGQFYSRPAFLDMYERRHYDDPGDRGHLAGAEPAERAGGYVRRRDTGVAGRGPGESGGWRRGVVRMCWDLPADGQPAEIGFLEVVDEKRRYDQVTGTASSISRRGSGCREHSAVRRMT